MNINTVVGIFMNDDDLVLKIVNLVDTEENLRIAFTKRTGCGACKAVRDNRPDIVVIDYCMPDCDGLDALRDIRENCREDIRIIFITQACLRMVRSTALEYGVNDLMVRPTTPEAVVSHCILLRRFMARGRMGDSLERSMLEVQLNRASGTEDEEKLRESRESFAKRILRQSGIPDRTAGGRYAAEAIVAIVEAYGRGANNILMKDIYSEVSAGTGAAWNTIEKMIRNSVKIAWQNHLDTYPYDTENLLMAGFTSPPSPKRMLLRAADIIRQIENPDRLIY